VITNTANDKRYVGVTRLTVEGRWRKHLQAARKRMQTALCCAIRKYGVDRFGVELVATCVSREDADSVERQLIIDHKAKSPFGYNLTDGGDGVRGLPKAIRDRITQASRGRHHTAEARAKIGEFWRGVKRPSDFGRKISQTKQGRPLSASNRAALQPYWKQARTEEHRRNLRLAWVRRKARIESHEQCQLVLL